MTMLQDFTDDDHPVQVQCGFEVKYAPRPRSLFDVGRLYNAAKDLWGEGCLMPNPCDPDIMDFLPRDPR